MEKFEEYFKRADLDKDGKISGEEARAFFPASNLPRPTLAQIWKYTTDENSNGFLGRQEFFNALKLVTVAQSKRELTPDIVKASLYGPDSSEIPAPQINLEAQQNETVAQSKKELTPDIVKASLHGADSSGIPALQINLELPPAQQNAMGPHPPTQHSDSRADTSPRYSGGPWMSYDTFIRLNPDFDLGPSYLFNDSDLDKDEIISGEEAHAFFPASNLPRPTLAQINLAALPPAQPNATGPCPPTQQPGVVNPMRPPSQSGPLPSLGVGAHNFPDIVKASLYKPDSRAGTSPQWFTRYDFFSATDHGFPEQETFSYFDSMSSKAPDSSVTRFDSISSNAGFDHGHTYSFDDSDPFGSSGPFKASSESQTEKNETDR